MIFNIDLNIIQSEFFGFQSSTFLLFFNFLLFKTGWVHTHGFEFFFHFLFFDFDSVTLASEHKEDQDHDQSDDPNEVDENDLLCTIGHCEVESYDDHD